MRIIDELDARQLEMDDELGTNAERGAARARAAVIAQELIASGSVHSEERWPLRMTL